MNEREHKFANIPVGTKVWCRSVDGLDWGLNIVVFWNENAYYVVDDEYATFRMAQIDGKLVEFNDGYSTKWTVLDTCMFTYPPECYRIAKDIPNLKTDDLIYVKQKPSSLYVPRHFARWGKDGGVVVWDSGRTSKTTDIKTTYSIWKLPSDFVVLKRW
jgi:hypothetical protein